MAGSEIIIFNDYNNQPGIKDLHDIGHLSMRSAKARTRSQCWMLSSDSTTVLIVSFTLDMRVHHPDHLRHLSHHHAMTLPDIMISQWIKETTLPSVIIILCQCVQFQVSCHRSAISPCPVCSSHNLLCQDDHSPHTPVKVKESFIRDSCEYPTKFLQR